MRLPGRMRASGIFRARCRLIRRISGTITCPSTSDTINFTFTTGNIPLGITYGDPWLSDASHPGDQPWPEAVGGLATESFIDPLTGVLLQRLGLRGNNWGYWNNVAVRVGIQPGADDALRYGRSLDGAVQCDGGIGQHDGGEQYGAAGAASAVDREQRVECGIRYFELRANLVARSAQCGAYGVRQFGHYQLSRAGCMHFAERRRIVRQFHAADDHGTDQQPADGEAKPTLRNSA